jgi:rhamnosyltransferase
MSPDPVVAPSVSVVIRCHNEARHIGNLLDEIARQSLAPLEVIVVDSGSTDGTLDIVRRHKVRLVEISPEEFTFGRSLNLGCAAAKGDVLVFASAHVLPVSTDWLERLARHFVAPDVGLAYGRQVGHAVSRFSERQLFAQQFPAVSNTRQETPFCNNANAAVRRTLWEKHPYDEQLTGLEDLAWGRWALSEGHRIVYDAEAAIIHIHEETARKIFRRYEREAIALRRIYPDSHLGLLEVGRLLTRSIASDLTVALGERCFWRSLAGVVMFRSMQYWGAYRGTRYRSPVTHDLMMRFYY